MNNIHLTEEESFYNTICANTMTAIWERTNGQKDICLYNFNPKNENHLAIFFIAYYSCIFTQQNLKINLPYFKRRKVAKLIGKNIKIDYGKEGNVDVIELMNAIYTTNTNKIFTFADIYNTFYKEGRA